MRWLLGLLIATTSTAAFAAGGIQPGSAGDAWMSATSTDDHGHPIIHSLRSAARELVNRQRYKWRVGISWRFRHALDNGMPSPEDRTEMMAIDDTLHRDFERNDAHRIVYFTTGGGGREVMLYSASEPTSWKRLAALFKHFPAAFPGDGRRWASVKDDAGWTAFDQVVAKLRTTKDLPQPGK